MKNKKFSLEDHLGYWLRFVSNHVSLSFAKRLAEYDLGIGEWVVLNKVQERGALSPAEIAELAGVTRGAASKLLDRLISKQLILREASLSDRRYQKISLSVAGEKLLPLLVKEAENNEQEFFGHLPACQRAQLIDLLRNIVLLKKWNQIPIN